MKKLTDDELKELREALTELNQNKVALGECLMQQQDILSNIQMIKARYYEMEKSLIEMYGASANINIETGEVTEKEAAE
jgi:hypothetical protein